MVLLMLLLLLMLMLMLLLLISMFLIMFILNGVDKHVDDDFNVQHDHHSRYTHACPHFLTAAAAGMDTPPYTFLLFMVIQKFQTTLSKPDRTSLPGTGAMTPPAVRACAAVQQNLMR